MAFGKASRRWPRGTCATVITALTVLAGDLLVTGYAQSRLDIIIAGLVFILLVAYAVVISIVVHRHWAPPVAPPARSMQPSRSPHLVPRTPAGSLDFHE